MKVEDLSKRQLCKLAKEVSMGMFDLLKMVEFKESTMMDCWLVHLSDDVDCESCPIVNGCRGVRGEVGKLEAEKSRLQKAVSMLNSMVKCGDKHSDKSLKIVEQAMQGR